MKEIEYVKKSFNTKERMWVKVICQVSGGFIGVLANTPVVLASPKKGDLVFVSHDEITDYQYVNGTKATDSCGCFKEENRK